jgi:hypothetical protein
MEDRARYQCLSGKNLATLIDQIHYPSSNCPGLQPGDNEIKKDIRTSVQYPGMHEKLGFGDKRWTMKMLFSQFNCNPA